jgi:hypothetical protein
MPDLRHLQRQRSDFGGKNILNMLFPIDFPAVDHCHVEIGQQDFVEKT